MWEGTSRFGWILALIVRVRILLPQPFCLQLGKAKISSIGCESTSVEVRQKFRNSSTTGSHNKGARFRLAKLVGPARERGKMSPPPPGFARIRFNLC